MYYRIRIMYLIILFLLFTILTGCAKVNECRVSPTVTMEQGKQTSNDQIDKEKITDQSPKELIKDSIENAQPGGQLKCSF